MTDIEYISRIALEQERRRRLRRPVGILLILIGALICGISIARMINDVNGHLRFLDLLSHDARPLESDRTQTAARIAYGNGIIAGIGLCGAIGGGALSLYHGLRVLLSPFRKERLLVEAYREPGAA